MVGRADVNFVGINTLYHFRFGGVAVTVSTYMGHTVYCTLELAVPGGRGTIHKVWGDRVTVMISTHGCLFWKIT